jgi:ATP-dependent DNA helicase RecG
MPQPDMVNLEERARTAISLGESHFREFKSALEGPPGAKTPRAPKAMSRDIGEALVAFANADGGELLIGVEDDGTITGIDMLSTATIEVLTDAPRTHVHTKTPLPPIRTARVILDGQALLYFSLQKSTSYVHLTSDGRCVQRRDLSTLPIPAEEILFDRRERESREYDREYIDGATANDLNRALVQTVADQISPGMSIEKCLQYLDLAEYLGPGLRLRRAALLLFANEPSRWHPRLQLRFIKVEGTELRTGAHYNVKSDQTVTGNILQLVETGWEALRPQLVQTRLGKDARFGTTIMYPELACREALVNAIGHRDYSEEGRGIEIYVVDDRMEVRNPGALLTSITLDDLIRLKGAHQSRNASTARVLREVGYMRELGEGMRRMFELMRVNELTSPELRSDANSFCVTLRHSTIYNTAQKLWLDQFETFNLNREQKAIVVLAIGGNVISPQEIWDSLGIIDTEHYRQLIKSLQVLGILKSEIPKAAAQKMARQRRVSVRNIPRFKITSTPRDSDGTSSASASPQPKEESHTDSPDPKAQLWIGNLPFVLDDSSLVEFLTPLGEVQDLYIPRDRETGNSKGYAFAEFESSTVAADVIAKLNGQLFRGRKLVARKANPRGT